MARFHADLPPSSRCPVHPDAPTVVILAGGLGTRLRSVVSDRPKVLADIAGRPFLSYWLDRLSFQGFHDVILSTGHLASHVEERFGSTYGPLKLRYSVEPEPLGTGGALRLASLQVSGPWVLALNGDSYCDVDLSAFYQAHQQRQARASLVVQFEPDTRRYGRITMGSDSRLENFLEKSDILRAGWINAGIYLLPTAWLAGVPSQCAISLERELLPQWLKDGIHGFPSAGRFIDIGTPESLAEAEDFFTGVPDRSA